MKRREDWPERLHAAILLRTGKPFAWGSNDCILMACSLIEAMTDHDPAASFRGQYTTQTGATKAIQTAGSPSLEKLVETIAANNGMKEVGIKFAQRGDLVMFETNDGPSFGIVHPNGRDAILIGQDGLRRLPVLEAHRAWRV